MKIEEFPLERNENKISGFDLCGLNIDEFFLI